MAQTTTAVASQMRDQDGLQEATNAIQEFLLLHLRSGLWDLHLRDLEAAKVILWAERLYGIRTDDLPSSCSDMGCGIRSIANRCSCHPDCRTRPSECCKDFSTVCPI
eukprot:symbB.v1.2.000701.t1/scaffold40.1/size395337/5